MKTFAELNTLLGGGENAANWSQHSNGDGWINKTAKVDTSVYVGSNAIVWGMVSGDAQVFGNARVYGDAQVFGNAWIYGNARVYGHAQVYGDAQVSGDAWVKSPLFVIGSRYSLTNATRGHIQIGCKLATFAWWLSPEGETFGRAAGFNDEEIAEYRAYIELFAKVGK